MSVQQFCLRWNNHQSNFISVCSSLLHNGSLVDVTLAAEGRQLQAHKIVLSTCSSYFQALFTANPCQHPIVILKDVQYNDLKTMVDFMYYGEVNVSQEQLPHILKTAEMLKIKGLADMPTDAATLTKSESKSSDHTDHLQRSGSGSDSLWDNSESQYQEQQQQQPSQHQLSLNEDYHKRDVRSQSPPQIRRTRSAESVSPPAARRKRLRKSPNNGSTDESYRTEAKISQFSDIRTEKMYENPTKELRSEFVRQNTTIEETENQKIHVQQIKPEIELPVLQHAQPLITYSRSLEIPGSLSPSEQVIPTVTCSQPQASNSEQPFISNQQNLSTAAKRNRFLIRQPRIKRESDNIHQTASLDIKSTNELIEYDIGSSHNSNVSRSQTYQENLLTVPPRIERHASEPLPVLETPTPHLLTVPSHSSGPPFLVKQHSHPLLPSQQTHPSSFLLVHSASESSATNTGGLSITRQLSHPLTLLSTESSPTITSTAISGTGRNSSKNDELDSTNLCTDMPTDYTGSGLNSGGNANINIVASSSLIASTSTTPSIRDQQLKSSSITTPTSTSSYGRKKLNADTTSNIIPPPITKAHSSSVISLSESFFSTSTNVNISGGTISGNNSSPMRVKSEDLQRSVSSPLVLNQEPPSFDCVSRSSHCPVIRPGPALGCNFCWNTIDAHGRILRRKTKYHCPECQTNLCIVPCFQEFHERQSTENTSTNTTKENSKTQSSGLKHHPKTESF